MPPCTLFITNARHLHLARHLRVLESFGVAPALARKIFSGAAVRTRLGREDLAATRTKRAVQAA